MNSRKKTYKAVIIGAGRIASGFDTPASRKVLTHAHAIVKNTRMELVGITDPDVHKGKEEAKKWKTVYFPNATEMITSTSPDLIIIASSDETHVDMLRLALRAAPGLIICEKPVVTDQKDIRKIRTAAQKASVPVIVNFRRRFDPTVVAVRDAFVRGDYGKVLSASALYTKGVLHNGSHMIDLLRYFFGEMNGARMTFRTEDFPKGEPTLGGVASFERCPQFHLMTGNERHAYLFELDILTERKRIRFVDEGRVLWTQDVVDDTVFKGDRVLGKVQTQKTGLTDAMNALITHAVAVLDGKTQPRSSLGEALRTEETCFQLLASQKNISII